MSEKSYMRGGMKRTIQMSCGMIMKGHPNEVNAKYERHIRCCEHCKDTEIKKMPKFDGVAGYNNGWNGLSNSRGNKYRPTEITTAVSCSGLMFNNNTPANSINKAMEKLNEPEYKAEVLKKNLGIEITDKESIVDEIMKFKSEIDTVDYSLRCWKPEYTKELMMTWTMTKIELIFKLMKKELGDLVKEEKEMKELVSLLISQGKNVEFMYI